MDKYKETTSLDEVAEALEQGLVVTDSEGDGLDQSCPLEDFMRYRPIRIEIPRPEPIQLSEGVRYKRRDGEVVTVEYSPSPRDSSDLEYKASADSEGFIFFYPGSGECVGADRRYDLIEELGPVEQPAEEAGDDMGGWERCGCRDYDQFRIREMDEPWSPWYDAGTIMCIHDFVEYRRRVKAGDDEQPVPMLCFAHGGSESCEESNTKHGLTCPRCDDEQTDKGRTNDPEAMFYKGVEAGMAAQEILHGDDEQLECGYCGWVGSESQIEAKTSPVVPNCPACGMTESVGRRVDDEQQGPGVLCHTCQHNQCKKAIVQRCDATQCGYYEHWRDEVEDNQDEQQVPELEREEISKDTADANITFCHPFTGLLTSHALAPFVEGFVGFEYEGIRKLYPLPMYYNTDATQKMMCYCADLDDIKSGKARAVYPVAFWRVRG